MQCMRILWFCAFGIWKCGPDNHIARKAVCILFLFRNILFAVFFELLRLSEFTIIIRAFGIWIMGRRIGKIEFFFVNPAYLVLRTKASHKVLSVLPFFFFKTETFNTQCEDKKTTTHISIIFNMGIMFQVEENCVCIDPPSHWRLGVRASLFTFGFWIRFVVTRIRMWARVLIFKWPPNGRAVYWFQVNSALSHTIWFDSSGFFFLFFLSFFIRFFFLFMHG